MNINLNNIQKVTGMVPGRRIVMIDGIAFPVGPCNIIVPAETVNELNGDPIIDTGDTNDGILHNWYRKYRSGWVEQGGTTIGRDIQTHIVFPIPMRDKYYCFSLGFQSTSNAAAVLSDVAIYNRDTTFMDYDPDVTAEATSWMVWGMAAD